MTGKELGASIFFINRYSTLSKIASTPSLLAHLLYAYKAIDKELNT